jgi:hypothetical protein
MPLVYKSVGSIDVRGINNPVVVIMLSSLGYVSDILRALPLVSGRKVSDVEDLTCFKEGRVSGCLMSDSRMHWWMVLFSAAKSIYSDRV